MLLGLLSGLFTRVSLVGKSHFDTVPSGGLGIRQKVSDWARSCSLAAVTRKASKCPNVSTAICTLLPFLRL